MKKNKNTTILTTIIILLPIIAGLLSWNQLPQKLPIHWNNAGDIDGWASKSISIFIIPTVMAVIHLFTIKTTFSDYNKDKVSKKMMYILCWIMPIMSIVMSFVMYSAALGFEINVSKIVLILVGFIFIIIGNYLPKNRPNNTVGFRIPWTLYNEENWIKTNRLGGKMFVLSGILFLVSSFWGWFGMLFVGIILVVLVPFTYSYILYRKNESK